MSKSTTPYFLIGGGKLGSLMRTKDWAATPLGAPDTWPQSLCTTVSTCLNCSFPILIWWGPELVKVYNDAYAEIIADKHPKALGSPGQLVWPEIWDTVGPMLKRVLAHGEAVPAVDLRLMLHRKGYPEECYFSFSYSPIRDESGYVAGVFCPVIETTSRVFAERQSAFLLDLEAELRNLSDPLAIKAKVCSALGRHLGVAHVGYAEIQADDAYVLVEGAWTDGRVADTSGMHRLDDYGRGLINDLRHERVVSVFDVTEDPRTSAPVALDSFAKIHMRSFLDVPLLKAGRLIAYPFIADSAPRRWTDYEISLLRNAAERAWAAIERVRAQIARARAEERLSYALDASGMVGTFDWHISTDTFYSDARFAALFSVDPEKGSSGAPLSDYLAGIHPEDRDRIANMIQSTIEGREKYVQEYRLLQVDGTVRWIEARGECRYDEHGKPWRFPGVVVDITQRKRAEEALRESEERLRIASEAAQIGIWDYDLTTNTLRWDERTRKLFGLLSDAPVSYDLFLAGLHPEDREVTHAANQQALDPTGSGAYDIEYRTVGLEDGITRWIAAKGKCYFENGQAVRYIGTVLDIERAKKSEELQRLLLREMDHRVNNLFAVVSGMTALSARSARTPQEMSQSLRGRLDALSRANNLVRPGVTGSEQLPGARITMAALARTILLPYADEKDGQDRIIASGPDVPVSAKAVTSLALVLHESATNAAKYGALSGPGGSIRIRWDMQGNDFHFHWEETGGPAILNPPQARGFGSALAERSIAGQLGGSISYDWRSAGLALKITIPLERLEV